MRSLLFLLLLFFSASYSFAQEDRISFKLHFGRALPQGSFGEKENFNTSGYAKDGIMGGFVFGIPFAKNVQVDFDFSRASFKVAEDELYNAYYTQYIIQIKKQNSGLRVNSSISFANYNNSNAFASLKLSVGEDYFRLYAKPGLGIGWFNYPTLSETLQIGQDIFNSTTSYESTPAFTFNISAGVEYKITDDISLDFCFQYLNAEYKVEGNLYAEDQNGNVIRSTQTSRVEFQSINLSLGLLFYIKNSSKKE